MIADCEVKGLRRPAEVIGDQRAGERDESNAAVGRAEEPKSRRGEQVGVDPAEGSVI